MLNKIIHSALLRHHFWRHADFDELSEVYVAMLFRSLALGLIGIFVPVYLLKLGYGLPGLAIFFMCFFFARSLTDILGAFSVARIGPKHTMLVSYVFQIVAALLFLTLPENNWPLALPAVIWGASNSLFFIAFHVDFSKIKHTENGGKELGFVNIMEKTGGMIGPALGGILATIFGAQYIFLIAIGLLLVGLIPLFKTAEPVKTKQKLHFKKLDLKPMKRDLISYVFFAIENNLTLVTWPAFLTLFVFKDNVYATIGGLASLGVMASIAAAFVAGKLVDTHKGGQLLKFATIGNAIVYLFRPFVRGIPAVLAVNIVDEALRVSYRIPYAKGWYDAADDHPGQRIVYISTIESLSSFAKAMVWVELFIIMNYVTDYQLLVIAFFIGGVASLLINTQRFKALQ